MNVLSVRSVCLIACLACLIAAVLISVYLSSVNSDWLTWEHFVLKFFGGTVSVFSLYLGSCAVYKRMLWTHVFQNRVLLTVIGTIATIVSACCLLVILPSFMHMDINWMHLVPHVLCTIIAATCIRAGTGWRAFGFFSSVYSLPLGVLAIVSLNDMLFPPPADPVGGAGINTALVMVLMLPFAAVALPTWIASMYLERWLVAWHVFIGFLCLPGSIVLATFLLQIIG